MTMVSVFIFAFVTSAFAMMNGIPTDDTYAAIGSIVNEGSREVSCTATLISANWIVTADHCNSCGESEEDARECLPRELVFQVGSVASKATARVHLKRFVSVDGYDVLFAELDRPITSVSPIPLAASARLEAGTRFYESVGFGKAKSVGVSTGVRLKALYKITGTRTGMVFNSLFGSPEGFKTYLKAAHPKEVGALDQIIGASHITEGYQVHAWDPRGRENGKFTGAPKYGWSSTCNGDSGGPLLRIEKGQKQVVGVTTSGFRGDSEGCIPLGTIISTFGPRIKSAIRASRIPAI